MADRAKSLKVFVSYSRTDVEFADQLVLALEDKGFEPILDRHDMSGGENWRERLGKLILSADAVTFILTERSAASEICVWEVEEARRLSKRILPVTPGSVANVKPPQALADLNWVPFYPDPAIPGSGFYYGVKKLEEALRVDLDWLRAQTRYSERAIEWARALKAEDLLLRGEALREAHAWLDKTPAGSSPPDGVRDFLLASEDAEQRRAAAARLQIEEREKAVKLAEAAVTEKQEAVAAKARTDRTLRLLAMSALVAGLALVAVASAGLWFAAKNFVESAERDAKLFAREANTLSAKGDKVLAMLVALSGDPAARKGVLEQMFRPAGYPAAREALARAYATNRLVMSSATGEPVTAMSAFADDKHFITFHKGGGARVWEVGNATPVRSFKTRAGVLKAVILKDGDQALVLLETGGAALIRLGDGQEQQLFTSDNGEGTTAIAVDPEGRQVLTGDAEGKIALWKIGGGRPIAQWGPLAPGPNAPGDPSIRGLAFSLDGKRFFSADGNGEVARWDVGAAKPVKRKPIGDFTSASLLTAWTDQADDMLIVGATNGRIFGVNAEDLQITGDLQIFDANTRDASVSGLLVGHDGMNAVAISSAGHVAVFRDGGISTNEFGSAGDISAGVQIAGGQTAVTGSRDGTVRQWSLERQATRLLQTEAQSLEKGPQTPPPLGVFLTSDGQQALLTYEQPQTSKLWRRGGSPQLQDVRGQLISPDGKYLVREQPGGENTALAHEVAQVADGKVVHRIDAEHAFVAFLARDRVVLEDIQGELTVWRLGAAEPEWRTGVPADRAFSASVAVSPDGSRMLATFDDKVRVWKIGQPQAEADITPEASVTQVAFLPDSARFAIGYETGGLEIWTIGSDRPIESFDGHTNEVRQIIFNANGSLMATSSTEGGAALWRVGQRERLQTFDVQGGLDSMTFDPDGKHVLIGGPDGVSAWEIEPVALADAQTQVRLACQRLAQLNINGFSPRDVLAVPILRGLPENPCVAMGITLARPASPPASLPPRPSAPGGAGAKP